LIGEASLTLLDHAGQVETRLAPRPTDAEPVTWVSASIDLPVDYVTEEPTGAP
jgi:hypothetical protein